MYDSVIGYSCGCFFDILSPMTLLLSSHGHRPTYKVRWYVGVMSLNVFAGKSSIFCSISAGVMTSAPDNKFLMVRWSYPTADRARTGTRNRMKEQRTLNPRSASFRCAYLTVQAESFIF